jgi:hypothetical protein
MSNTLIQVYVLWHTHEYAKDHFDLKLIGIYSSLKNAEEAKSRALEKTGFIESSENLSVAQFTLDRDIWPLGGSISDSRNADSR